MLFAIMGKTAGFLHCVPDPFKQAPRLVNQPIASLPINQSSSIPTNQDSAVWVNETVWIWSHLHRNGPIWDLPWAVFSMEASFTSASVELTLFLPKTVSPGEAMTLHLVF